MYLGPELLFEYRYSTMLNTIFISLMYGTGMPILYLFGFISFWLTYWVDKWTLLRIYQTPPMFNKELLKTSREWINVAIIIHFVFGFWMYSNSLIFETSKNTIFGINVDSENESIDKDYSWLNIHGRLSQYHCLLYFIGFVVFLIIFFLKSFLFRIFKRCSARCCKNRKLEMIKTLSNDSNTFSTNYYRCLDKTEFKNVSSHLQEDIQKFKDFKRSIESNENEFENFTKEDKEQIDWLLNRLKEKRQEVNIQILLFR
jgi:hypothetical protein